MSTTSRIFKCSYVIHAICFPVNNIDCFSACFSSLKTRFRKFQCRISRCLRLQCQSPVEIEDHVRKFSIASASSVSVCLGHSLSGSDRNSCTFTVMIHFPHLKSAVERLTSKFQLAGLLFALTFLHEIEEFRRTCCDETLSLSEVSLRNGHELLVALGLKFEVARMSQTNSLVAGRG